MTTYEELDRTVYEHIRRQLVTIGALPDRKLMTAAAYKAAKDVLEANGTLIEVFGQGGTEARDKKKINRITILRRNTQRGSLGAFGIHSINPVYDNSGNTEPENIVSYTKVRQPSGCKNVIYEIRSIAVKTKYERIMIKAINDALGYGDYINIVDPATLNNVEGKEEFLAIAGDVDVSSTNFIERLFTYQYLDVWVDEPVTVSTTIVPITEIDWNNTFPAGTPPDNDNVVVPD